MALAAWIDATFRRFKAPPTSPVIVIGPPPVATRAQPPRGRKTPRSAGRAGWTPVVVDGDLSNCDRSARESPADDLSPRQRKHRQLFRLIRSTTLGGYDAADASVDETPPLAPVRVLPPAHPFPPLHRSAAEIARSLYARADSAR